MSDFQYSIAGRGPGETMKTVSEPANTVNKRVADYLLNLTAGNFSGKLHLTFENGKIVHVVNEKYIKP